MLPDQDEAEVEAFYTGLLAGPIDYRRRSPQGAAIAISTSICSAASSTAGEDGEVLQLDVFEVAAAVEMDAASIAGDNERRFAPTIKNVVSTDAFGDITEGRISVTSSNSCPALPSTTFRPNAARSPSAACPPTTPRSRSTGNRIASANSSSAGRTFELEQISINNAGRVEVLEVAARRRLRPTPSAARSIWCPAASFDQAKPSFSSRAFVSRTCDEALEANRGPANEACRVRSSPASISFTAYPVSKIRRTPSRVLESNIYYPQHRTGAQLVRRTPPPLSVPPPARPTLTSAATRVQDGPKTI